MGVSYSWWLSWKGVHAIIIAALALGYVGLLVCVVLGEVEVYLRNRRQGRTIRQTFFSGSDLDATGLLGMIVFVLFNLWVAVILFRNVK